MSYRTRSILLTALKNFRHDLENLLCPAYKKDFPAEYATHEAELREVRKMEAKLERGHS